jgi:polyisoprenyl-phosphate glycosyltransferase
MHPEQPLYLILSPCYNEGRVIRLFLEALELKLKPLDARFRVIVIDDHSTDDTAAILEEFSFKEPKYSLTHLRLNYNMGHQEAIRQGLQYVNSLRDQCAGVIIMDSDGEDNPEAISELLKQSGRAIVYVERGRRHENFKFKAGYFFYRMIFWLVTGKKISFGNYSMISREVVAAIAGQRFSHYAGFLSKQRFPIHKIKYDRSPRLAGISKMNYNSLVIHGLSSLIEYAEEILLFFLKLFGFMFLGLIMLGLFIVYSKFVSHKAISGWASTLGINLLISLLILTSTIALGLLLLYIKKMINKSDSNYEVRQQH